MNKKPIISQKTTIKVSFFLIMMILPISLVLGNTGVILENPTFIFDENITESNTRLSLTNIPMNYSNLTSGEKKLSEDLLEIICPEKVPWTTSENRRKIIQTIVRNKMVSSWNSDAVYVTIRVRNGISTHFLDPYIHLPVNRIEGWPYLSAWVYLPNIINIANMSDVIIIYPSPGLFTNSGLINPEGDQALHSHDVREIQNGPNGPGIRIGIISNGVNNIISAKNSGDLPHNVNVWLMV